MCNVILTKEIISTLKNNFLQRKYHKSYISDMYIKFSHFFRSVLVTACFHLLPKMKEETLCLYVWIDSLIGTGYSKNVQINASNYGTTATLFNDRLGPTQDEAVN